MTFESQTIGISDTRIIIVGGTLNLTGPPSPDRAIRHRAFDGAADSIMGKVTAVIIAGISATLVDRGEDWSDWTLHMPNGHSVSIMTCYEKRPANL